MEKYMENLQETLHKLDHQHNQNFEDVNNELSETKVKTEEYGSRIEVLESENQKLASSVDSTIQKCMTDLQASISKLDNNISDNVEQATIRAFEKNKGAFQSSAPTQTPQNTPAKQDLDFTQVTNTVKTDISLAINKTKEALEQKNVELFSNMDKRLTELKDGLYSKHLELI